MTGEKELIVVGGPNGAGKSTFVRQYLQAEPLPYIGADAIAYELDPVDPSRVRLEAGRRWIEQIDEHIAGEQSFVAETTLSGRSFHQALVRARSRGFNITIVFVFVESATLCAARVRHRVLHGGHDVPKEDIFRRFARSLENFWTLYRSIAQTWMLVCNSEARFIDVAIGEGESHIIDDDTLFASFLEIAEARTR